MIRPRIAVIGAGPSGLMAAEAAAVNGADVTVFDRMPSVGRKFLLAGRGGLNLTHSEPTERFLGRYGSAMPDLRRAIVAFDADALRAWCADLGIETFVGSSGRVFPAHMKSSPLLRAWLRRLATHDVQFALRHEWRGWADDGASQFATPVGPVRVTADATILALGGASWSRLGSDGSWAAYMHGIDAEIAAFKPANCGFHVSWSEMFRDRFEGEPLKSISVECSGATARGDAVVTRSGIEGGAIYAISSTLRNAIERDGHAVLRINLRPDVSVDDLAVRIAKRQKKWSLSTALRKTLGLSSAAIGLLREAAGDKGSNLANLDAGALATLMRAVPLRLDAPMSLDKAISTAGGVTFANLDEALMLKQPSGVFVAGEMLDWEAPTGGYLLQACFATGRFAGSRAAEWARAHAQAKD